MKAYYPYLFFFLRFIFVYIFLTIVYHFYLSIFFCQVCFSSDPFTTWVADKSSFFINLFGFDFNSFQDPSNPVKLLINGNEIISVVNEGCNALSVIILFLSFLSGLYAKLWQTVLFSFFGVLVIGLSNVFRITLINLILLYFPDYSRLAHDVIFPIFIYGILVLLWLIWIWKFAYVYWLDKLSHNDD